MEQTMHLVVCAQLRILSHEQRHKRALLSTSSKKAAPWSLPVTEVYLAFYVAILRERPLHADRYGAHQDSWREGLAFESSPLVGFSTQEFVQGLQTLGSSIMQTFSH
jgi:hypothetical protein